ncbi:hypothetical protein FDP22_17370 [Paroceanicella profunda]|uniref:Uncharacterized protein n=1 Tax=Paroceanicella profunda TaxID=2579971 RepID=A0A5B8FIL7_9RHOB|nr:hypothetical protein [Paroceanicella profunda]QDL93397.1 hypothetical protein FDP22_17370 [Paroceanicella profunda]
MYAPVLSIAALLFLLPTFARSSGWLALLTAIALMPCAGFLLAGAVSDDRYSGQSALWLATVSGTLALCGGVGRYASIRARRRGTPRARSLWMEALMLLIGLGFLAVASYLAAP